MPEINLGHSSLNEENEKSMFVSKREEVFSFLILAIVIWPFLSVAVVGGYGFIVWMLQLVFGPPGPPA